MSKLKAIAYYRVSTEMQEEKESLSTQVQGGEIFCRDNDIELVKIFSDVMSGGNRRRPGFLEAKKYMEENKGKIDMFIAYDVSRIARDAFTFLELFNHLNMIGIKLKLINNPTLDSDSAMGKLILTILAAIFDFFRFDNSSRVRDNMVVKVKEGKRVSGAPYGYKIMDKKMVIVEEEAEIIRYVFDAYLEGKGLRTIAKEINRDHSTISNWLNNKVYAGYNIFGKTKINKTTFKLVRNKDKNSIVEALGDWKPIISLETFERVQLIRDKNKELKIKPNNKSKFLLSGILFHQECNDKFRGSTVLKNSYYRCFSCGKLFKSPEIESVVLDELINGSALDSLNKKIKNENKKYNEKVILEKTKSQLEAKKKRLKDFLIDGTLDKEDYNTRLLEVEQKLLEVKEKEKNIDVETVKKIDTDIIKVFKKIVKNINIEDRGDTKKILRKIIKKINIDDEKNIEIYLNI